MNIVWPRTYKKFELILECSLMFLKEEWKEPCIGILTGILFKQQIKCLELLSHNRYHLTYVLRYHFAIEMTQKEEGPCWHSTPAPTHRHIYGDEPDCLTTNDVTFPSYTNTNVPNRRTQTELLSHDTNKRLHLTGVKIKIKQEKLQPGRVK